MSQTHRAFYSVSPIFASPIVHPLVSLPLSPPSSQVGGVLPFGAIFIEVFFIMSSVWHHQYFYMFGFLLLVLAILIITCAEITIVLTYFQLCSEDYHWCGIGMCM